MASKNQLQKELKQKIPFPTAGQEAIVGLMRTADMIRRQLGEITREEGISTQQYNVLRILRGAESKGLPILEIADRMIERSPGITRFIYYLEDKKLLVRERSNEDRRCQICTITAKGKKLVDKLDEPINSYHKEVFQHLNESDIKQLNSYLDSVRNAV